MDTAVDLKFADGEYHFALLLPQIFELERNCGGTDAEGFRRGKSIFQIYEEISAGLGLGIDDTPVFIGGGKANAKDIRETIRLGLIGGGLSPIDAKQLVDDYCFPVRPMTESLGVAWAILRASIEGVQIKKKEPKEPEKPEAGAVESESELAQNPSPKGA